MVTSWSEHVLAEDMDLFPDFDAPGASIRYVIIGTPRSGTNLLCSLLQEMGYGVPAEYYSDWMMDKMIESRGFQGPLDYYTGVMATRTSADGVFGCKTVQPGELGRIRMAVEPNVVIRMSREDKDAQAESFVKAMKTGNYVQLDGEPSPAVVVTDEEREQTRERLAQMEMYLNENIGNGHLLIGYEYLVNSTDEVLRHIAQMFGDELPEDWTHPTPKTRKMGRTDGGAVDLSEVVS